MNKNKVVSDHELREGRLVFYRKDLNLIIVSITKHDGRMVFNPGPDTTIDDTITSRMNPRGLVDWADICR